MRGKRTALPPPAAAAPAAGMDHTAGLNDRSLSAILLRLPSPATLARAAAVCRRWRRVASSPALLRLFRRLHPPPLLGFFICNDGFVVERINGVLVGEILSPTFFTSNPAEPPGLSGAVSRCINFSLDSLPDLKRWALANTSDGILLFCASFSSYDRLQIPRHFVVCDPVTGRSVLIGCAPRHEIDDESSYLGASLLLTDGGDAGGRLSFEVIVVTYFMWGPRLLVFSSRSGAWTVHPYADVGGRAVMPMPGSVGYDMHANGCVYWVIDDKEFEASEYLMALDTRTKAFSTIKLLAGMRARYEGNMRVVRTYSGELRLVALAGTALDFWRLDRSRSSRGRWVRKAGRELTHADGALALFAERGCYKTVIMDAADGFVFFKHFGSDWVFVLDLHAMALIQLPHRKYYFGPALPYRMTLQPPFPVLD